MTHAIQEPITGKETFSKMDQAFDTLVEFYKAFNEGDFDLMASNWLQTPDASMSNPLGGLKRGWDEIQTVYRKIFNGPANVYVEYYDYTILPGKGFFQAVGRERGCFSITKNSINLKIRTSRTYVMHEGRYRQLHQHGSIEEPSLLATYQMAVMTGNIE